MKESRRQIALARKLRQSQTDAEKALWARLKNKQVEGVKFRRQQPLASYIVDFVSFERKIIVEVMVVNIMREKQEKGMSREQRG